MKMEIVKHRKIWFLISGTMVLVSLLAIATLGIRFGIDFTGGTLLELETAEVVDIDQVRSEMETAGFEGLSIKSSGENGLIVRSANLDEQAHQELLATFGELFGEYEEMRFDSIGPVIGEELRRTASMGVVLTLLLIGLYIAWAFRKVSEPVSSWKYGILTILAAFHDVIITIGAFSLLGHFFGWEVGTAFVAAMLTILGYSINDTVVVFDRTRENLLREVTDKFEDAVEMSLQQTVTRSLNTSATTLLALAAIFLFGGDSTRPFALALIIGIAVGTYSSLFLASPALVEWELRKK
jgi:preprotein translocase subunit SecF